MRQGKWRRASSLVLSLSLAIGLLVGCAPPPAREVAPPVASSVLPLTASALDPLVAEHAFGGVPSEGASFVRNAYVMRYDAPRRVPRWVAYHLKPDYLKTPPRKGTFKSFRKDPDVSNAVVTDDYVGLYDDPKYGFARGHLAPYKICGGDRNGKYAIRDLNGDGKFTEADKDADGKYVIDDPSEVETVKQVNYMSNIAPQHHKGFNGWDDDSTEGLWFSLERWIQDTVVRDGGHEVWVFAGCIFGDGEVEKVGPDGDIGVPNAFYKIVIRKSASGAAAPKVLAFLFPHQRKRRGELQEFLVSIDVIEALTGLDFFGGLALSAEAKAELEAADTSKGWAEFLSD